MLNRYIPFLILLLLGILLGFSISLTFIVAPLMFSHFSQRFAGEIMQTIFPYYFASGWLIGIIIYTFIAILSLKEKEIVKKLKAFIIALSIMIFSYMALHKAILPIAESLNNQYYSLLDAGKKEEAVLIKEKFKKVHALSSSLNLMNIFILAFLFYNFYFKIKYKEL